jgi:hypothetical protein
MDLCVNVGVQWAREMIGVVHQGNLRHDGQYAQFSPASGTNFRRLEGYTVANIRRAAGRRLRGQRVDFVGRKENQDRSLSTKCQNDRDDVVIVVNKSTEIPNTQNSCVFR